MSDNTGYHRGAGRQNYKRTRKDGNSFPLPGADCAQLVATQPSVPGQVRTGRGQFVAELPLVLWVLILLLTIPLTDIVTFTIRYDFLLAASRDAAFSASRAKTFSGNVSPTDLSAVNTALATAKNDAAAFREITVTSVTTNIVITKLSTGIQTRQQTPLSLPADTVANTYQIETIVNGTANPILTVPASPYWGSIPGLTAPIPVSIASRAYFENPQGLNQ